MKTIIAIIGCFISFYCIMGTHWRGLLHDISSLYNDITVITVIIGSILWLIIGVAINLVITLLFEPRDKFEPQKKKFIVSVLICLIAVAVAVFYPGDNSQDTTEKTKQVQQERYIEDDHDESEALEQFKEDEPIEYALTQNPDAISWEDASERLGEYATVCGIIEAVDETSANGDPIFVDMGDTYPNERVTGVIWSEYQSEFQNVSDYSGDLVYMSGKLYEYNGVPNIELTDSSQIQEVE